MVEVAEILTSATAGFIVSAVLVLTQMAKNYVDTRIYSIIWIRGRIRTFLWFVWSIS